jgi:hypothetical protein
MALTIFSVGASGEVEAAEVDGPTRIHDVPAVKAGGHAFYIIDQSNELQWVATDASAERVVGSADVPESVRAAGEEWLATYLGRRVADFWHSEEPSPVPEGTDYHEWAQRCAVPASADEKWLSESYQQLAGREPTRDERRAFERACKERLFDISPCGEVEA